MRYFSQDPADATFKFFLAGRGREGRRRGSAGERRSCRRVQEDYNDGYCLKSSHDRCRAVSECRCDWKGLKRTRAKITSIEAMAFPYIYPYSFQPVATTSHYLVLAPFEILAIMWCGVHETGLPFLIGMLALLLLIPIQVRISWHEWQCHESHIYSMENHNAFILFWVSYSTGASSQSASRLRQAC